MRDSVTLSCQIYCALLGFAVRTDNLLPGWDIMRLNSVLEAFDLLLEEVRGAIGAVNKAGGAAQTAGRLEEAEQALARSKALGAVRSELEGIRERLKGLVGEDAPLPKPPALGPITKQRAYRVPILRALVQLGGSASSGTVVDLVGDLMRDTLSAADLEHLTAHPERLRWRTAARFCHSRMKKDGLLSASAPFGTWTITEAGRRWLEKQEGDQAGSPWLKTQSGA